MNNMLLIVIAILAIIILILQFLLLRRKTSFDPGPIQPIFESIEKSYERAERAVRDEISVNRKEMSAAAQQSREELAKTLKDVGDSLTLTIGEMSRSQAERLASFGERLDKLAQGNGLRLGEMRQTIEEKTKALEAETAKQLAEARQQTASDFKSLREEITGNLKNFGESTTKTITEIAGLQKSQLDTFSTQLSKLTETNEQKLDALRVTVEGKLKEIQQDNTKQLDQMRATVDEKLQGTLEKRLGESFKQVSERLEQVYKGLGEMQALASGVGDLKKVLTNVKTRGTWGEVQLWALLEEVLTPDQYGKNVAVKDGSERVEFAVKLPGRDDDKENVVWLPIDAKFPQEDYQRLIDAQEKADPELAEAVGKQLEARIRQCASDICDKYINPPKTTDFGILFLPTEGLFAEVIRRTALTEFVQHKCRVMIAGPTTLWSILSSLQMGFRTLAIEKRSSEVWNLLAAVKTEWTKYGEVLGKVQKKLHEASDTIEKAQTRNRVIGRRLKEVQTLPADEARTVLMVEGDVDGSDEDVDAG